MNVIIVTSDSSCVRIGNAASWFAALSFISTSLLLFFRVRAICHNSLLIQALLASMWVAVVICTFALLLSIQFSLVQIALLPAASGCTVAGSQLDVTIDVSLAIIYDTLVWLALSTRLLMNSSEETWPRRLWMFMRGGGMPPISRLIFQTEQLSYA